MPPTTVGATAKCETTKAVHGVSPRNFSKQFKCHSCAKLLPPGVFSPGGLVCPMRPFISSRPSRLAMTLGRSRSAGQQPLSMLLLTTDAFLFLLRGRIVPALLRFFVHRGIRRTVEDASLANRPAFAYKSRSIAVQFRTFEKQCASGNCPDACRPCVL